MITRPLRAAALAACAVSLLASAGQAQTTAHRTAAAAPPSAAPPAEAPAAVTQGPPIASLCTWSPKGVIATSKVGQYVFTRLKTLDGQIRAELQPSADGLENEGKTLQAQQATMDQATLQVRAATYKQHQSELQKKAQLRSDQWEATKEVELDTISKQMMPVVRDLYQQHRCSILFNVDSGGITNVSPAMDLSLEVVNALNAKVQSLQFDLMTEEQLRALVAQAQAQGQQQQR
jgi:Skp family chaperone for outer membrane proteins